MISQNPEMVSNAMDMMKNMPEDERRRMLEQRANMAGRGGMPANQADAIKTVMENPDALKTTMDMMKNIPDEDLAKMTGGDPSEVGKMREAAEQMAKNPDMTRQMTE